MKMSPTHKRKPSFDRNMRFKGSHATEQPSKPVIVMKSGERMCLNRACKRIFRPAVFGEMHCSETCKRIAPERNPHNRGVAVNIAKIIIIVFIIGSMSSCHGAFTDAQLRTSIENIQRDITVLQSEQQSIAHDQHLLFARYRSIYKRMAGMDTNRIMSPDDSVSVRMQLLMATVSLDAIVASMKTESVIYADLNDRITDMVIAMDELEFRAERASNHNIDIKTKFAGWFVIVFFGVVTVGFLSIIPYMYFKRKRS